MCPWHPCNTCHVLGEHCEALRCRAHWESPVGGEATLIPFVRRQRPWPSGLPSVDTANVFCGGMELVSFEVGTRQVVSL